MGWEITGFGSAKLQAVLRVWAGDTICQVWGLDDLESQEETHSNGIRDLGCQEQKGFYGHLDQKGEAQGVQGAQHRPGGGSQQLWTPIFPYSWAHSPQYLFRQDGQGSTAALKWRPRL